MKEATPTLSIALNVHCPLCKQYVNLLENNDVGANKQGGHN